MMIESTSNPLVKQWKKLKDKKYRKLTNEYLVEGVNLCLECIAYRKDLISAAIVTADKTHLAEGIEPLYIVSEKVMETLGDTEAPQGIILVCKIISNACISIEFYDDKIVQKRGVFSRWEKQSAFFGVKTVNIYKTFRARIFGYGDVIMDNFGGYDLDVDTYGIRRPEQLKKYLDSIMEDDLNKVTHVFGA